VNPLRLLVDVFVNTFGITRRRPKPRSAPVASSPLMLTALLFLLIARGRVAAAGRVHPLRPNLPCQCELCSRPQECLATRISAGRIIKDGQHVNAARWSGGSASNPNRIVLLQQGPRKEASNDECTTCPDRRLGRLYRLVSGSTRL
jgi:hypothetical protein